LAVKRVNYSRFLSSPTSVKGVEGIGQVENSKLSVINSAPTSESSVRFTKKLERALASYFLYKFGVKLGKSKLALVKFLVLNRFEFGANLMVLARVLACASGVTTNSISNIAHDEGEVLERFYYQAYRFVRKLHELEMVNLIVHEGRLHVVATPRLVDLIVSLAKFKPHQTPRRMSYERKRAFALLARKRKLEYDDWLELFELLDSYRLRTAKQVLLFRKVDEDRYLLLHYKHRFLKRELKKRLKDFERAWDNASANYGVGVFITLTMDPKRYSNFVEACDRCDRAFNRFRSFLRKRYGKGFSYLRVPQPQDSGNPHLHVVLFGLHRIEDHRKLTGLLRQEGFGEIHYEYKIKKDNNGNWVWANPKKRPNDARTNDVRDYLRNYLKRAFYVGLKDEWEHTIELGDFKIAWYFALNKRFFTCSRDLLSGTKKGKRLWIFIGVYYYDCLPKFVERYLFLEGYELAFDGETWSLKAIDSCATPSLEYP